MYQKLVPEPYVEDIIQHKKKPLVLASGGLDSAYMMYKLTEAGNPFLVHHITRSNLLETAALQKQLDYLGVSSDRVLYSTISGAFSDCGMNIRSLIYLSMSVAAYHSCDAVVIGDGLDMRTYGYDFSDQKYVSDVWGIAICLGSKAPDLAAEYKTLPEDYRSLTWSCHQPVLTGTTYKTCGQCGTCQLHKKFGLEGQLQNTMEAV